MKKRSRNKKKQLQKKQIFFSSPKHILKAVLVDLKFDREFQITPRQSTANLLLVFRVFWPLRNEKRLSMNENKMNRLYKLTGQGEFAQEPDIFFNDEKLAKKTARIWNLMAAVHDPEAVALDRYEVTEISDKSIIKNYEEMKKAFREYLK